MREDGLPRGDSHVKLKLIRQIWLNTNTREAAAELSLISKGNILQQSIEMTAPVMSGMLVSLHGLQSSYFIILNLTFERKYTDSLWYIILLRYSII